MIQGSAHLAVARRCWGSLAEFKRMLPCMVERQLRTHRLAEVSELEPEVLCAPRARFRATSNQCDATRLQTDRQNSSLQNRGFSLGVPTC